ncbi:MAG: metallophosphoesterase [Litorimonas sp.]
MSGFGLMLLVYGLLIEPSQLKIRQVEFSSTKYTGPKIRIALLTDLHINGLHVPPSRVLDIVDVVNAQNPDIVLLPGDFVSGHEKVENRSAEFNKKLEIGVSHLEHISAPTFATIGNHDAWWDAKKMHTFLENAGVTVLENQAASFECLCIVGLADQWTSSPDPIAFEGCSNTGEPIAITHSPDAWQTFRADTILAMSGHTHGGQVNLPIIGRRVNAITLGPEYSYGFSEIGGVDMFVSAGVGTSILPIRFRAPPEIVLITLTSAR